MSNKFVYFFFVNFCVTWYISKLNLVPLNQLNEMIRIQFVLHLKISFSYLIKQNYGARDIILVPRIPFLAT